MAEPLVSVGLQFFNNEKTLGLAIQSILNQSFQDWELVIHDDGSTDAGCKVVSQFADPRIKFYPDRTNRKRPARLNESLSVAKGKYYAIMDGDDVAYPERLLKQVQYLEGHPEIDLLGAQMLVFRDRGEPIGRRLFPLTHEQICSNPSAGFPMAQPTFMGRTEWFRKHRYDPRARAGVEDQDLLLRSYWTSRFANLPEVLMGYRETGLYLKKLLKARYYLCQSLVRHFRNESNPASLMFAVATQSAKALGDCVAIITGLNYRLLQHRAHPVTEEERQEWARVWESVNRDEQEQ